jgi:hypothetical protein
MCTLTTCGTTYLVALMLFTCNTTTNQTSRRYPGVVRGCPWLLRQDALTAAVPVSYASVVSTLDFAYIGPREFSLPQTVLAGPAVFFADNTRFLNIKQNGNISLKKFVLKDTPPCAISSNT